MKKTYISPEFILVELSGSGIQMLAESVPVDDNTASGTNGGWVKEESTPLTDKNLWDEEW